MSTSKTSETESKLGRCLTELNLLAKHLKTPLCVVYVYSEGDEFARLLGTEDDVISRSNQSVSSDQTSSSSRTASLSTIESNVPKPLVPRPGEIVFAMGSLSKQIITLRLANVVENRKIQLKYWPQSRTSPITWDTPAYPLLNDLLSFRKKDRVTALSPPVTLRQLVCHEAFPPMTSFLLSYAGGFKVSIDDFLNHAASIANKIVTASPGGHRGYSNCNYILILIILKEFFDTPSVAASFTEYVQNDLKLSKTTFNKEDVEFRSQQEYVPRGYEIPADLEEPTQTPEFQYMDNDIERVLLGGRTCAEDYAKILKYIMAANELQDDPEISDRANVDDMPISKAVAETMLRRGTGSGITRSNFGLYGLLNSDLPGRDSINWYSWDNDKPSYTLGYWEDPPKAALPVLKGLLQKKDPMRDVPVQYKGGMINGYTATVYYRTKSLTFVIAFTNGTGPLSFGEYACQNILQDLLPLSPRVDLYRYATGVDLTLAQQYYRSFHKDIANYEHPDPRIDAFVGVYEHNHSNQWIEIVPKGEMIQSGIDGRTDRVQVRVEEGYLRVFPTALDRWADFSDVRFELCWGGIRVLNGNVTEAYTKKGGK